MKKRKLFYVLMCCILSLSIFTACSNKQEKKEETTVETMKKLKPEKKTYTEVVTVKSFNDDTIFTGTYTEKFDIATGEYLACEGEETYSVPADIKLSIGAKVEFTYSYMTNSENPQIKKESVRLIE